MYQSILPFGNILIFIHLLVIIASFSYEQVNKLISKNTSVTLQ